MMDRELPMSDAVSSGGLTARTDRAIAQVLAGRRRGIGAWLPFAGPAFVASIAYIDPGNFATNIEAGAHYGYGLLWVVLLANALAMLFQALSARLGIATGHNLAELSRQHFPTAVVYAMWGVSEAAVMATDLAEFLGGAIGLSLLFHLPLLAGMLVTAAATYLLLMLEPARLPAAGIGHHRHGGRDQPQLRPGAGAHRAQLAAGAQGHAPSGAGRRRCHHPGGGHRGCDGDAARDLPAFRAHPGPWPRGKPGRAAAAWGVFQHRGGGGAQPGRPG